LGYCSGHYDTWFYKGIALNLLLRYSEAIECFDKALEIRPNYKVALEKKNAILKSISSKTL
jgi:tetratricopeptide (TPR) repeat protein